MSETQTLTLTDFLLARIAEDEAAARAAGADAMVGARWKSYPREAYEELQGETLWHSKRVLAECEAKRRIVEHLRTVVEDDCEYSGWVNFAEAPIRELAAVYADHPEYREEWAL